MLSKKTKVLLTVTLLAVVNFSTAQKVDLQLMYQNDENGKIVFGNIKKLIASIREGHDVRISWTLGDSIRGKIEHFANAKFITIMSDSVVFAQIDPIVGQTPNLKERHIYLKDTQWEFIASTTGNNESVNRNAKTLEIINQSQFKCGIKWFVIRRN